MNSLHSTKVKAIPEKTTQEKAKYRETEAANRRNRSLKETKEGH